MAIVSFKRLGNHSAIHKSQEMETTQGFITDEWMNKMWSIHSVEYYLAIR